MALKSQINNDMKVAMKAGDKDRLKVVRLVLAAIKQIEIDNRSANKSTELDDVAVLAVINKMVKQRHDSVSQFKAGGRDDLVSIELAEIEVLTKYLPQPLSEADLDSLIEQVIADTGAASVRDMAKVMGLIKSRAAGRANMATVGSIVKARLA